METLKVADISLDVDVTGSGPPLLYLHAGQFTAQVQPFLKALAQTNTVIAPVHPGFGSRPVPEDFRSLDDLAYLYLDLLAQLDVEDAIVVGASFGSWIALEMCVRNLNRAGRLVLISPVGLKFSDRDERDFADIFYLPDREVFSALFADPDRWAPNYTDLPQDEVEALARERQALAYFAWKPFFHNPGLMRWLHRVDIDTLVLGGERDRFTMPGYAGKVADALPRARLELITEAGHYPQIEQSQAVLEAISAF